MSTLRTKVAQAKPAGPTAVQIMTELVAFAWLQVRVVEFNTTTSFKEQLQAISETGVFISVHTSNLANAQFLPPGAAVFEIIQRNWVWENLDKSFQVWLVIRKLYQA